MSHTIRRKHSHTRHQRGRPHIPDVARRPRALRAKFIADLLTQERADLISTMPSGKVRVNDSDIVLAIRNGVVASVIVEGRPD